MEEKPEKKIRTSFSLKPSTIRVIRSIPPSFRSEFIDFLVENRNRDLDRVFIERIRSRINFDYI